MLIQFIDVPNRARSRNDDGSVTSVCTLCGLTIARAFAHNDLLELERRHVCQPKERRRVVRVVHRIYEPNKGSDKALSYSKAAQTSDRFYDMES